MPETGDEVHVCTGETQRLEMGCPDPKEQPHIGGDVRAFHTALFGSGYVPFIIAKTDYLSHTCCISVQDQCITLGAYIIVPAAWDFQIEYMYSRSRNQSKGKGRWELQD